MSQERGRAELSRAEPSRVEGSQGALRGLGPGKYRLEVYTCSRREGVGTIGPVGELLRVDINDSPHVTTEIKVVCLNGFDCVRGEVCTIQGVQKNIVQGRESRRHPLHIYTSGRTGKRWKSTGHSRKNNVIRDIRLDIRWGTQGNTIITGRGRSITMPIFDCPSCSKRSKWPRQQKETQGRLRTLDTYRSLTSCHLEVY